MYETMRTQQLTLLKCSLYGDFGFQIDEGKTN